MPTTVDDVTAKTEMLEMETKKLNGKEQMVDHKEKGGMNVSKLSEEKPESKQVEEEKPESKQVEEEKTEEANPEEAKQKEIPLEVEPKTGVSFPVELDDGKQLKTVGLRKKSMLGLGIKIYSFGIYAENQKLKDLLRSKIEKAPTKPTKDMYQMVIDSDVGTVVKLIIVFSNLTMSMVRKNFDEGLGAAIKKLTGGKKDELTKKIMGEASDDIKLTPGSEIEISRLPGYVLETKVKGEVVSKVDSELLCRAYMYLYLGDDPFDKEAKEKFGISLLPLF